MIDTLEQHTATDVNPMPLYTLALGFAATKSLLAAQRLGIFETLAGGAKTASQVAQERRLSERGTEILLDTCVALRLCRKNGGQYANGPLVEKFLTPGKRGYLGRFLDHFNDLMYPTWAHLEDAVRTGHAQVQRVVGENDDNFFQAIDRQMAHLKTFMETMEEHSLLEGKALADSYDFSAHRTLLDVGGGTGAMSVAILERHPHLKSIIFDRPPVAAISIPSIRSHGLGDRIQVEMGDFLNDALPKTADVVLLSAILHNWPHEQARTILRQCASALPSGGTLLISDQVLTDDKTGPLTGLLCSLNMLIMMEGAQEYSHAEFVEFLNDTGFDLVEVRPTGGVRQLLIAKKR